MSNRRIRWLFLLNETAMLLRYTLNIGTDTFVIPDSDFTNWEDIECSFSRASLGGVVRSFSSEFEFARDTASRLTSLFIKQGVLAKASIEFARITERWGWESVFIADFDFTTAKIKPNGIFSIGCVDDSLAALIKANKSTTYEFLLGEELDYDIVSNLPRIPLLESAEFQFTKEMHSNTHKDGSICVRFPIGSVPWVGRIGDGEIENVGVMKVCKNQHPNTAGEDEPDNSCWHIMQLLRGDPVEVTLEYTLRVSKLRSYHTADVVLQKWASGGAKQTIVTLIPKSDFPSGITPGGTFPTPSTEDDGPGFSVADYNSASEVPEPKSKGLVCVVNGYVWISQERLSLPLPGSTNPPKISYYWQNTGVKESDDYYSKEYSGKVTFTMENSEYIGINAINFDNIYYPWMGKAILYGQSMKFTWQTAAYERKQIRGISPAKVCKGIVEKMAGERHPVVSVTMSDHDTRLAKTYLFPAEGLREIPKGKLYSSFKNFTEWMEVVFGYTYQTKEDVAPPKFGGIHPFHGFVDTTLLSIDHSAITIHGILDRWEGAMDPTRLVFLTDKNQFAYMPTDIDAYLGFPNVGNYNVFPSGVREDMVYKDTSDNNQFYIRMDDELEESIDGSTAAIKRLHNLVKYTYNEEDFQQHPRYNVHFLHRSELFGDAEPLEVECGSEFNVSVYKDVVFASINIGYKKQNYDRPSGRDEFNFNSTYTTGCTYSDKTLSMISPYRADSYGVEFTIRNTSDNTTDDKADKDLFFIAITEDLTEGVHPDYSGEIIGVKSQRVFNRMFSPMACVNANKEYLGIIGNEENLTLTFASSEGNAEITIDGTAGTDNITITDRIAMAMEAEFDSIADADGFTTDLSRPIVVTFEGVAYTGYIMDLDVKYAMNGAASYKMLIRKVDQL